jgi:hypothetical protein
MAGGEWYCKIMGEEWGPMSAVELIAVARWGRLSRDDQVRRVNSSTWVRAELVKGLFNSQPVAATVSSDRLVAAAKKAAPAKRSVRKSGSSQYWVKIDEKISGPFSSAELRQMAERGSIKPNYLIGRDRQKWIRAADVKGLSFGGARADARTMSVRSAVVLDKPFSQGVRTAGFEPSDDDSDILIEAGR